MENAKVPVRTKLNSKNTSQMRIKRIIVNYRLELLLVVLLALFVWLFQRTFYPSEKNETAKVQANFIRQEEALDRVLRLERIRFEEKGLVNRWQEKTDYPVYVHIYRNDSLLYWNTNDLPILRFADIHFPSEGVIHLQNGWYFSKIIQLDRVKICASFLIKRDYSYENKELLNHFSPEISAGIPMDLTLELNDNQIHNREGVFQFGIELIQPVQASFIDSVSLFCLFVALSVVLFLLIYRYWLRTKRRWKGIFFIGIIGLRIAGLQGNWFSFLNGLEAFQPKLYATSEWFPNFGELVFNLLFFTLVLRMLHFWVRKTKQKKTGQLLSLTLYFGFFLFWPFFNYLLRGLIENSSISFRINQLFELNIYSYLAIASLGLLFHGYALVLSKAYKRIVRSGFPLTRLMVATFVFGFFYFLFEINFGNQMLLSAVFPFLFLIVFVYFKTKTESRVGFTQGLILFFLFTATLATSIGVYNERKERTERELYANQLKTDKDIRTELEFSKIEANLRNDTFLNRFIEQPSTISSDDFQYGIERRIFDAYWEQYDLEFYLFNEQGEGIIGNETKNKADLDRMMNYNGVVSEVNKNVYFIADYIELYSYMFRFPLLIDGKTKAYFYATLKSKRIPEEIGFPRLLISNQAKVFQSLENYSIAKYYDGQLLNKYGDFNYPTLLKAMPNLNGESQVYVNYKKFSHYFLKKGADDYVVLSTHRFTSFDLLTTFSYLFCFLGILVLPLLFRLNEYKIGSGTLSLAVKIQLVLILLVFISLLIYGYGSGIFVRDQYNSYTNQVITEKLNSVQLEFQSKFGEKESLTIENEGNQMDTYLKKFAKVFVTDINFYDPKGYLLSSSRPKVFNLGLISEQMNPKALLEMQYNFESEFTHQEQIGKLKYSSAYVPFFSNQGDLQGFLNLQHFGQQKDFEYQIQRFLTAIINVFMLLLAVSIVVAIFVSGWLTAPLRVLQESFAKVNLGQRNEPILYHKEDEIGALVKEYNKKIEELAIKAKQLAQSERESAWREMAKQVAHEIKNPLTPMKLGLQQFERVYDPENPLSKEKLKKVTQSIIEQIDGLTRIANEFANFAKMPQPQLQEEDICTLLEGVIHIFGQTGDRNVRLVNNSSEIRLQVDKDMMIRVFNNLIKNAVQALQGQVDGRVEVFISKTTSFVKIEVKDNGVGISEEQKMNIFVPYFTTKSTGTGLGLAMVKQIIELHKGVISFQSVEGEGTSFFVELKR